MIERDMTVEQVKSLTHECACHACEHGCHYGSGILIGKDFENLAKKLGIAVEELKEKWLEPVEQFGQTFWRPKLLRNGKPYGPCIFFDKGCTVHDVKPLQCTLAMGCKDYGEEIMVWFMEQYLVDPRSENSQREFRLYKESGGKTLR